jgi:hypothetical protein
LIAGGVEAPLYPDVVEEFGKDNVSGKLGSGYTPLYASVSRGFKSGGFQGRLSFDPAAPQPFEDETVLAYKVGMKTCRRGSARAKGKAAYRGLRRVTSLFSSYASSRVRHTSPFGLISPVWRKPRAR